MATVLDPAVAEHLPGALALAMTLTSRPATATELVGSAAAHRSARIGRSDPAITLRNAVVHQFVGTRRGRTSPTPTDPTPSVDLPAELTALAGRLDQLTPLQRAAVVLSRREQITQAEIAGLLDRPATAVARALAEAEATLDAPTGDLLALLDRLAWAAPEPDQARTATIRTGRQLDRRRRRIGLGVSGLVGALVFAVLASTVIVPRLFPVHVRQSREWASGFVLPPPAGWTTSFHYLQPDRETYAFSAADDTDGCSVTAEPAGGVEAGPEAVRVNGKPGWYGPSREDGARAISWRYAPAAVASLQCSPTQSDQWLLAAAQSATFAPNAFPVPYRLTELPAGLALAGVATYPLDEPAAGYASALAIAPAGLGEDSEQAIYLSLPGDRPETRNPRTIRVVGSEAVLATEDGRLTLCVPVQRTNACLQTSAETDDVGSDDQQVRRLTEIAARVEFAADLDDRGTWFDAREALPR